MRTRRAAGLVLALALVAAGCAGEGSTGDQAADGRQPEAAGWPTWVLGAADQIALPAPPDGEATAAEELELRELSGQRTPEMDDAVRRWDAPTPDQPWNELHLQVVAERAKDPVAASRGYALMSVAVYDATVSAWHWKYAYGREPPSGLTALAATGSDPSYPSEHAVVAGAASRLLAYLNPDMPAARFDQMAEEAAESRVWAGTNFRSDVDAGLDLGRRVADAVIAEAETDGSHDAWDGSRPEGIGTGPQYWEPPPGSVSPPTQPLAGTWDTWVLESGDQLRAEPPPPYGSAEFLTQAQAVIDARANLTPEQEAIAKFWAGGQGTSLPPGLWNQVALDYVSRDQLTTPESARVFALLNTALADAGVACWDTKYTYWLPRPVNVIRDLGLDPDWEPYLRTPNFPSYTSGHATYSGAASEVLAYLFPLDAEDLRAKAQEAAESRLYGGIHFPMENERGLAMGRALGRMAVERAQDDGSS